MFENLTEKASNILFIWKLNLKFFEFIMSSYNWIICKQNLQLFELIFLFVINKFSYYNYTSIGWMNQYLNCLERLVKSPKIRQKGVIFLLAVKSI